MDSNSYCAFVATLSEDNVHRHYHDHEYGFPLQSDDELLGRLILEINQAGLSWSTILKKAKNFRAAYSNFEVAKIAQYSDEDRERLLQDAGIIRNRLKVDAAIYNARQVLKLQAEYGSFKNWLDHNYPLEKEQWVKLFKQVFKFTGGEITGEFLMSTGYLPGAHVPECPVYSKLKS